LRHNPSAERLTAGGQEYEPARAPSSRWSDRHEGAERCANQMIPCSSEHQTIMIMGKDEGKVQGEQVSRHTQAGRLPEGATKRNAAADQPKTGDDDPHHAGVIVSPLSD